MYITEDGYFWTNAFNGAYLYRIGTDAAKAIIDYAVDNAVPGEFVPYMHRLAGTITEIGDGYILVDDSILCADPAEGMVFKILTEDIRLRRCLEYPVGHITPGEFVMISFTGSVEEGNVISQGYHISPAFLSENGDVLVQA